MSRQSISAPGLYSHSALLDVQEIVVCGEDEISKLLVVLREHIDNQHDDDAMVPPGSNSWVILAIARVKELCMH